LVQIALRRFNHSRARLSGGLGWGARGRPKRDIAVTRNDDPSYQVGEQAYATAEDDAGGDHEANERDINVKVVSETRADSGDLLVRGQAVQAPWGSMLGTVLLAGSARDRRFVTAVSAKVIPII
jgi:hypothetical protein